jgi:hypothetical protein
MNTTKRGILTFIADLETLGYEVPGGYPPIYKRALCGLIPGLQRKEEGWTYNPEPEALHKAAAALGLPLRKRIAV